MIHLVTGGARSGKSTWAQHCCEAALPAEGRAAFLATATAGDGDMARRIARHQADRDERWVTVEEPLDLTGALRRCASTYPVVLVDCLTLWMSNLMFQDPEPDDAELAAAFASLASTLEEVPADCLVVLVTNEVGLGIVPANALARRYRDQLGWCNQAVARVAERVTMLVSGLPLTVKPAP